MVIAILYYYYYQGKYGKTITVVTIITESEREKYQGHLSRNI